MGELQTEPFQFTFNGFLKVAFQGSRITSDAGLILVRELDERLGLETLVAEHLSDSRQGLNTQFTVADLLRQSATLRPGNVHSADDWDDLRVPEDERQQAEGTRVAFRADAAFAKPAIYDALEERGRVQRSRPGEERAHVWSGV